MKKEYYAAAWILLFVYTAVLVVMLVGSLRDGVLMPITLVFPFLLFLPSYTLAAFIQRQRSSVVLLVASVIVSAIPVAGMLKFGPASPFVVAVFLAVFLAMIFIAYRQYKECKE